MVAMSQAIVNWLHPPSPPNTIPYCCSFLCPLAPPTTLKLWGSFHSIYINHTIDRATLALRIPLRRPRQPATFLRRGILSHHQYSAQLMIIDAFDFSE